MHKIIRGKIIPLILFSCVWGISLSAQYSNKKFKNFNVEEGLSHSTINKIIKDNRGFMWFATDDGLNQFNGYTFNVFKNSLKDTNSLSSNLIKDIYEDSKGRLWVLTRDAGINLYDRANNSFIRYMHHEKDSTSLPGNLMEFIFEDSKANIWIGTQTAGLARLIEHENHTYSFKNYLPGTEMHDENKVILSCIIEDSNHILWIGTRAGGIHQVIQNKSGEYDFIKYKTENKGINALKLTSIIVIFEDSEGVIWVGSDYGGLFKINRNEGGEDIIAKYHSNSTNKDCIGCKNISTIFEDSKKNLWVGSLSMGLNLFDREKGTFTNYLSDKKNRNSLPGDAIVKIIEDKTGVLWIGTGANGLSLFDIETGTFENLKHNVSNKNSLTDNLIVDLFKDDDENIWIGTRSGGISFYDRYNSAFRHFKHDPLNEFGLNSNTILSFCEDDNGGIWVGTDGGSLNLFDTENLTFTNMSEKLSGTILSIHADSQNNLWMGTWARGIHVYNKQNNSFKDYVYSYDDSTTISSQNVWSIFEDSENNIWFGTCCNGLNLYKPYSDSFIYFKNDENDTSSITGNCIWSIYEDKRKNLWIGTTSGLSKLYRDKNGKHTFINYKRSDSNNHSISNDWVWSIFEDSDSNLWIGTNGGGLNLFDRDKETFIAFTEDDGLPNNVIYGILEDEHKNLWLSTNYGLSRFNPKLKRFKNFDTKNGLENNQFSSNSYMKARNGEMYFGGVYGFYVFHPDSIKDNYKVPKIVITDFKLFNSSVEIGTKDSPLKAHISEAKSIKLSYKQSSISFEYVALNYTSPEKNEYAYMLEGFDPDWNYVGSMRTAYYTNLDPGEYIFRVKGSNNDGLWNEEGTSISVIITPPFWQTWWFRSFAIVFLAVLVLGIFYFRIRSIRKTNLLLKTLVVERTKEINNKNIVLQEQTEQLYETNTELEERQQKIEEQSEQLMAQRDELSEVNSVKDKLFSIIAHDLKNPFNTILGYSELLKRQYNTLSDDKRIRFIDNIFESSERLFDLLENLLTWSQAQQGFIKFSPTEGNITNSIAANIELVMGQAEKKQISFKLLSFNPDFKMQFDANLLNAILRNLLTNAIKFSKENSLVTVNINKVEENVEISVKDTGVGISKEDQKKLFKKNYNFSTYGTNNEKGTGIGLLMCKDFVEKHGGKIWIISELEEGSTFVFTLPIRG